MICIVLHNKLYNYNVTGIAYKYTSKNKDNFYSFSDLKIKWPSKIWLERVSVSKFQGSWHAPPILTRTPYHRSCVGLHREFGIIVSLSIRQHLYTGLWVSQLWFAWRRHNRDKYSRPFTTSGSDRFLRLDVSVIIGYDLGARVRQRLYARARP